MLRVSFVLGAVRACVCAFFLLSVQGARLDARPGDEEQPSSGAAAAASSSSIAAEPAWVSAARSRIVWVVNAIEEAKAGEPIKAEIVLGVALSPWHVLFGDRQGRRSRAFVVHQKGPYEAGHLVSVVPTESAAAAAAAEDASSTMCERRGVDFAKSWRHHNPKKTGVGHGQGYQRAGVTRRTPAQLPAAFSDTRKRERVQSYPAILTLEAPLTDLQAMDTPFSLDDGRVEALAGAPLWSLAIPCVDPTPEGEARFPVYAVSHTLSSVPSSSGDPNVPCACQAWPLFTCTETGAPALISLFQTLDPPAEQRAWIPLKITGAGAGEGEAGRATYAYPLDMLQWVAMFRSASLYLGTETHKEDLAPLVSAFPVFKEKIVPSLDAGRRPVKRLFSRLGNPFNSEAEKAVWQASCLMVLYSLDDNYIKNSVRMCSAQTAKLSDFLCITMAGSVVRAAALENPGSIVFGGESSMFAIRRSLRAWQLAYDFAENHGLAMQNVWPRSKQKKRRPLLLGLSVLGAQAFTEGCLKKPGMKAAKEAFLKTVKEIVALYDDGEAAGGPAAAAAPPPSEA